MRKGMHCTWLSLLALGISSEAHATVRLPYQFVNEVILQGLDTPRAFAFLPDGRALLADQRTGAIHLVMGHRFGLVDPLFVVPEIAGEWYEQGLQGIAVDPAWPERPYVYLYYTAQWSHGRLVRYTVTGDVALFDGEILEFEDPMILIDDIPDLNSWHNAGALHFGPDSCLYLSLGDDGDACAAQDSTSLRGCILRLDPRRLPPGPGGPAPRALLVAEGNPFPGPDSSAAMVYAYGFRNPWSFGIDRVDSTLVVADVGELTEEELDVVVPGGNYGWPYREGMFVHQNAPCQELGGSVGSGFVEPVFTQPHGSGPATIFTAGRYRRAPNGIHNWPDVLEGDLFWGDYFSGVLRRLQRGESGAWLPAAPMPGQPDSLDWGRGFETAVDFAVAPDGSLWWLSQYDEGFSMFSGRLQRIRYDRNAVLAVDRPSASGALSIAPNPSRGAAELTFSLGAAGHVRLAIYDLAGRRVRSLSDGAAAAGATRVRWDGADESGRVVAPGVYLARLEYGGAAETRRLVRIR